MCINSLLAANLVSCIHVFDFTEKKICIVNNFVMEVYCFKIHEFLISTVRKKLLYSFESLQ